MPGHGRCTVAWDSVWTGFVWEFKVWSLAEVLPDWPNAGSNWVSGEGWLMQPWTPTCYGAMPHGHFDTGQLLLDNCIEQCLFYGHRWISVWISRGAIALEQSSGRASLGLLRRVEPKTCQAYAYCSQSHCTYSPTTGMLYSSL